MALNNDHLNNGHINNDSKQWPFKQLSNWYSKQWPSKQPYKQWPSDYF